MSTAEETDWEQRTPGLANRDPADTAAVSSVLRGLVKILTIPVTTVRGGTLEANLLRTMSTLRIGRKLEIYYTLTSCLCLHVTSDNDQR